MPIRQIPGTDLRYYLIAFDENGRERPENDGTMLSGTVRERVADPANPVTDVFFTSHGWKGDIAGAIEQYDSWIGETEKLVGNRSAGNPLIVGLHWPSLPWGDEKMPSPGGAGVLGPGDAEEPTIDEQVEAFASRIADTPRAREALRTILEAAAEDGGAGDELPDDVANAYMELYSESGLASGDINAPPGADQDEFDPKETFKQVLAADDSDAAASPGVLGIGDRIKEAIVGPLRQLSFYKMKDRGRRFGETGAHELLRELQSAAPAGTRFHLMGHSFGCIVVSATVAGPPGGNPLPRPVNSLFLVQGALSLWSFCNDIPYASGKQGYFSRIVDQDLVDGPIVTTHSVHDKAVGKFYPLGAKLKKQLVLANTEFPEYGGIGAWGAQGLGTIAEDITIQPATFDYGFSAGRVYNIDASSVISKGDGASGAHSDIAHPEVANLMLQAARAGR
jgi:hypothetical protein